MSALPECLTRTSADDCKEANRYPCCGVETFGDHRANVVIGRCTVTALRRALDTDKGEIFDAALAAIQRREAEAVYALTRGLPQLMGAAFQEINRAAQETARTALSETENAERRIGDPDAAAPDLTPAQRATLLDAARALVRLALEIAG